MPVHAYGGSILVNVTRMVAADGKINIAPGNAEASRSKTRLIWADKKKMPVHAYGGSISAQVFSDRFSQLGAKS